MIPKQTPVRNFCPDAPPQTSLFSSLPLAPPRKSASSSSLIRPLCVQSKALYLVSQSFAAASPPPYRLLYYTAHVIFRPAFPARPVTGKELPCLPAFFSQPTIARKPYTAKMSCIAIVCGGKAAPAPSAILHCRVIFRPAFPQSLSREGKLCAYHLSLETCGFQTAQRDMMTCIAIGGGKAPLPSAILHCPRHLPSRLSARFVPGR